MNIVFDLGGVVFNWQPGKIIAGIFKESESIKLVSAEIFGHSDWVALDRGTLSRGGAIERAVYRTKLPLSDISRLFDAIPKALTPIDESIDLINSIRNTDNKLYVLSNMHHASIEHLERESSIWDMFDGIVVSCRVKKVKPELEIYEHLLKEFNLVASETVFIDDMAINLQAASSLGIKTIQFDSAKQCRLDLEKLKCI